MRGCLGRGAKSTFWLWWQSHRYSLALSENYCQVCYSMYHMCDNWPNSLNAHQAMDSRVNYEMMTGTREWTMELKIWYW